MESISSWSNIDPGSRRLGLIVNKCKRLTCSAAMIDAATTSTMVCRSFGISCVSVYTNIKYQFDSCVVEYKITKNKEIS